MGDTVAGFGKGIWGGEGSFTEFQDYVQPGVVLAYLMWRVLRTSVPMKDVTPPTGQSDEGV